MIESDSERKQTRCWQAAEKARQFANERKIGSRNVCLIEIKCNKRIL